MSGSRSNNDNVHPPGDVDMENDPPIIVRLPTPRPVASSNFSQQFRAPAGFGQSPFSSPGFGQQPVPSPNLCRDFVLSPGMDRPIALSSCSRQPAASSGFGQSPFSPSGFGQQLTQGHPLHQQGGLPHRLRQALGPSKQARVRPPGQQSRPASTELPEQPARAELPQQPLSTELPQQPASTELPEQPARTELPEQPSGDSHRPDRSARAVPHQVRRQQQQQRQQNPGSSRNNFLERVALRRARAREHADNLDAAYALLVETDEITRQRDELNQRLREKRSEAAKLEYGDSGRRAPPPRSNYEASTCGNCDQRGHTIRFCVHPSMDGFVHGCPSCNQNDHDGGCRMAPTSLRTRFERAVVDRQRRPPLAAYRNWPDILRQAENQGFEMPTSFPWTPAFLATIAREYSAGSFPWETFQYRYANISTLPVDETTRDLRAVQRQFAVIRQELTATPENRSLVRGDLSHLL